MNEKLYEKLFNFDLKGIKNISISDNEIYNQFLFLLSSLKEIRYCVNFNENYVLFLPIFPTNCNTNNVLYNKSINFFE